MFNCHYHHFLSIFFVNMLINNKKVSLLFLYLLLFKLYFAYFFKHHYSIALEIANIVFCQ